MIDYFITEFSYNMIRAAEDVKHDPLGSEKRDTKFITWKNRPTGSCLAHFYKTSWLSGKIQKIHD